ncbi:MAG: hypothetical protein V3T59_03745, partial [Desulfobacterales bacterium]
SPERSEVEFFNFSAASRRTLQIVPTMSSEVQTLVNRNIFMTTGIKSLPFHYEFSTQTSVEKESCRQDRIKYVLE